MMQPKYKRTPGKLHFLGSVFLLYLGLASSCGNFPQSHTSDIEPTQVILVSPTDKIIIEKTEKPTGKSTLTDKPTSSKLTFKNSTSTLTPIPPLNTQEPFFGGPTKIGESVEGRALEVYRFGTGPIQSLIIAGIHGGYEWNTTELARQLIDHIIQNPDFIPPETTLYILPTLNPDGEARGHGPIGRANSNEVDLNRNFPSNWLRDWPRTGCWQMGSITAGNFPLSEPESRAVAAFLNDYPIQALISIHSAAPGVFPGRSANSLELAKLLSNAGGLAFPPLDTGCKSTGMLADFAADLGIAAVDLELSTHWDTELEKSLKILNAFMNWLPSNEEDLRLPID